MEDFFKAVDFRLCVVMFNRMMFLKCLRSSENWVNLCRTEIHQYWRSPHWVTRNVSTYSRFILFYNFSLGLWYNNTGAIDVKMDGSVFEEKNHHLRYCGWLSLLNWMVVLTLSLLLKLLPRKFEPRFVLWSFFLLRLLCVFINIP